MLAVSHFHTITRSQNDNNDSNDNNDKIDNDKNDKNDNDNQAASILKAKTTERSSCAEQESHVRSHLTNSSAAKIIKIIKIVKKQQNCQFRQNHQKALKL